MVGTRLAELRRDKGLTQKQFADKFKISLYTVKAYEQGKNKPDDEMKIEFAKYFNVSCDYILGLTNDEIPLDRKYCFFAPRDFTKQDIDDINQYIRFLQYDKKVKEKIK